MRYSSVQYNFTIYNYITEAKSPSFWSQKYYPTENRAIESDHQKCLVNIISLSKT